MGKIENMLEIKPSNKKKASWEHHDSTAFWKDNTSYFSKDPIQYGHYDDMNREYVVTNIQTPRPWLNYITNDEYGVIFSQTGKSFSFYRAMHAFKITLYTRTCYLPRDPDSGRYLYLRDAESGEYWMANPQSEENKFDTFECRHGLGYSIIKSAYNGIESTFRLFVPLKDPVEIWTIKLKNTTAKKRTLKLFPFLEWYFPIYYQVPIPHIKSTWATPESAYENVEELYIKDLKALLAVTKHPKRLADYGGFIATDTDFEGYDCSKKMFFGEDETALYPRVVIEGKCKNSSATNEKMVGAFCYEISLNPGEEKEINILAGVAYTEKQVRTYSEKYLTKIKITEEFNKLTGYWNKMAGIINVKTPNPDFDRFINIWLKLQVHQTKRWCAGYDQGFRDALQMIRGFCPLGPEETRTRILHILKYQYKDGTAVRKFSEVGGPHDNSPYMDSPTWIPDTLITYIKETGDLKILDEEVEFLDGGKATVYEHALVGLRHLYDFRGAHNLCLIGGGDWNDALEGISKEGKAEGVWLTVAVFNGMKIMEELASLIRDEQTAKEMNVKAAELKKVVNEKAWDGEWYIYAFTDHGIPVGSNKNEEGKIHLNVQTWALFTGIAEGERKEKCLQAIDALDTVCGNVTLAPPYTIDDPTVGRIPQTEPGLFENCAIYCHAVTFKVYADCILRLGNRAMESYLKVLPTNPKNPPNKSCLEPFTVGNFFVGPTHPRHGMNIYPWLTSTGSWLFFVGVERMLGIRPEYTGLRIDPVIPSDWKEYKVTRHFRDALYEISIENPDGVESGVREVTVDGKKQDSTLVPIFADKKTHNIKVILGKIS